MPDRDRDREDRLERRPDRPRPCCAPLLLACVRRVGLRSTDRLEAGVGRNAARMLAKRLRGASTRRGGLARSAAARGRAASRAMLARPVRERDEAGLEGRRRQVDARARASRRRSAGSARRVGLLRVREVRAPGPGWKKKPNMPPTAAVVNGDARLGAPRAASPSASARRASARAARRRRASREPVERREPGRHRERIPRERAGLVDRARRARSGPSARAGPP